MLNRTPLKSEREPHTLEGALRKIERLIEKDSDDPKIIRHVRQLLAHVPDRRFAAPDVQERLLVYEVWRWIVCNISFLKDPIDVKTGRPKEVLADCAFIFDAGAGDCDEHVILAATMLAAVGIRSKRWIGGINAPRHIWNVAYPVGMPQGINVDTTLKRHPFGTRPGDARWSYWACSV